MSATPLFEENDGQGRVLAVFARVDGKAAVQIEEHGDGFGALTSFAADPLTAPDLCRAICVAAGTVPPVMLGRPEVDPDCAPQRVDDILVGCLDGKVTVALYGVQPETVEPAQARKLAALIAACADAAEAWPSGAEVDELAGTITDSSNMLMPSARLMARKILLAGWKREADRA